MRKVGTILILLSAFLANNLFAEAAAPTFSNPAEAPKKAEVVVVSNSRVTEHFLPQPPEIPAMIEAGLAKLTGKSGASSAWRSLVATNDVIGIKVYASPGRTIGTRPEVVSALIESLLSAGIERKHIIIWDKQAGDLYLAGFGEVASKYGVRLESAMHEGYDETAFYESSILGTPVWGDLEFEKKGKDIGRKSYVSKLVTKEMTKIICVTPLLNHNLIGVTGNLYSLAIGSIDNSLRFQPEVNRLSTAIPEIYALPQLSDHVVLCITDALIGQYQGEHDTLLHYSSALNQLWFSKDPVALDTLAMDELKRQRRIFEVPQPKQDVELYKNATLLELGMSDLSNIVVNRVTVH